MSSKVKYLSSILAPVSLGELIDKITILEIKQMHMTGIKLKNIVKELKLLKNILQAKNLEIEIDLINNLKEVALSITQYFLSYKWSLEYKNDFVKNEDQLLVPPKLISMKKIKELIYPNLQ